MLPKATSPNFPPSQSSARKSCYGVRRSSVATVCGFNRFNFMQSGCPGDGPVDYVSLCLRTTTGFGGLQIFLPQRRSGTRDLDPGV